MKKEEITKLYFDTEFTGLQKWTTLISLGIISEDDYEIPRNHCKFYAEFTDYDKTQCNDWINKNVIKNTVLGGNTVINEALAKERNLTFVTGTREEVREALKEWLKQFESVQFISDVCHYDFVLLIDLFGTAFDLPDNMSPTCHDINQEIARYYQTSERKAFDKSREEILEELELHCTIEGVKHNALYDAKVLKSLYKGLQLSYNEEKINLDDDEEIIFKDIFYCPNPMKMINPDTYVYRSLKIFTTCRLIKIDYIRNSKNFSEQYYYYAKAEYNKNAKKLTINFLGEEHEYILKNVSSEQIEKIKKSVKSIKIW